MRIVITGADGFIGRHLALRVTETGVGTVVGITRQSSAEDRAAALASAAVVVHLAGVNRPPDPTLYGPGNAGATEQLCSELLRIGRKTPVIFSSSAQATLDNPYGRSKRAAEEALTDYAGQAGAPVAYFRFRNVFGKWARPNYNSAVATFCYNVARNLPITVNDASAPISLIHVDDAVAAIVDLIRNGIRRSGEHEAGPVYETTVGAVADQVKRFAVGRDTKEYGAVGAGLCRALYSTYVSYLPPESFSYPLQLHRDPRGTFAEMLRTPDAGQFSFFTAVPGVTRGGHYHHTKTEKFLVVHGKARFGFRQVLTGERHELIVDGSEARVVETVPGWAHDITNVGQDVLVVLLWANEAFDPSRPDTIPAGV